MFIFAADVHLADRVWSKRRRIAWDSYFAWRRLIDLSVERRVPIVLGGDLFDTTIPPPTAIREFRMAMDRLKKHRIPFFFIQGDHDYLTVPLASAISSWPTHLHKNHVNIGGIDVVGLDWTTSDRLVEEVAGLPPSMVAVTHQTWKELFPFGSEGSITACMFRCQLLCTGDVHQTKYIGWPGLEVCSPGSLSLQKKDEHKEKFASLVSIVKGGSARVTETLNIPQLRKFATGKYTYGDGYILSPEDAEYVRIQLDGDSWADPVILYDCLETNARDCAQMLEAAIPGAILIPSLVPDIQTATDENGADIQIHAQDGCVQLWLEELISVRCQGNPEVTDLFRRVWSAGDIDRSIDDWVLSQGVV